MEKIPNIQFMQEISQRMVYLMGISFILGSLCTIFILLMLDMTRKLREEAQERRFLLEEQAQHDEEA